MKKEKRIVKVLLCAAICTLFWFVKAKETMAATCTNHVAISGATCTRGSVCRNCGKQLTAPLGHAWGSWETIKEPTCATSGEKQRICTRYGCGVKVNGTIPATGNHVAISEATCTSASVCRTCGKQLAAPLGHVWGSWTMVIEPICGENGTRQRICTRCGYVESTIVIPVIGEHVWGSWQTIKEPTCATSGTKQRSCTRGCGAKETATIPATEKHVVISEATCTSGSVCRICGKQLTAPLGHAWGSWETIKEPTCATSGTKQRTCIRGCGVKETATIPATGEHVAISEATCTSASVCRTCGKQLAAPLGHVWGSWTMVIEPICGENGTRQRICTRCGYVESTIVIPVIGEHVWGSWQTIKEPTCATSGTKQRICTRGCGAKETATIPATGKHVVISEATCTSGSVCRICGIQLTAPLGHAWGSWETIKEPTCATSGTKQRTCIRGCGVKETATIPATGEHVWGSWQTIKEPTCASEGMKQRTCTYGCGAKETATIPATGKHVVISGATCTSGSVCRTCGKEIAAPLGHAWGNWSTIKEPTCVTSGTKQRTCTRGCGAKETATIPATGKHVVISGATCTSASVCRTCGKEIAAPLGHVWGNWSTIKEPTCATSGTKQRICTRGCGAKETAAIPATGEHVWGLWKIIKEPTCASEGTKQRTCTYGCGAKETATIPATGEHVWGSWQTIKEPTCVTSGTKQRTCTRGCGAKETATIPATGKHVVISGATCTSASVCRTCGKEIAAPLGHAWGNWSTIKEPTCVTSGTKQRICTRGCGAKETATIPATGEHVWGSWQTIKEPTCASKGMKQRTCTYGCGAKETATIPATGEHVWGSWQTIKEPTCASEGTKQRTCTRGCGAKETATIPATGKHVVISRATCTSASVCRTCGKEIAAPLGHAWGKWSTIKEPTCATSGTKQRICTRGCGAKETVTIPATEKHVVISGATCTKPSVCKTCGKVLAEKLGHAWAEATCYSPKICKRTACQQTQGTNVEHKYENGVCIYCEAKQDVIAEFKVTFDMNGGQGGQDMNTITVNFGESYGNLPVEPTRPGYTFTGWYTAPKGGTLVTATTEVEHKYDHKLYAHWESNTYEIVFDGNGKTSGSMETVTVKYGEKITLPKNAYAKNSDTFSGWSLNKDGIGRLYKDGATVDRLMNVKDGKVTLYAVWGRESFINNVKIYSTMVTNGMSQTKNSVIDVWSALATVFGN